MTWLFVAACGLLARVGRPYRPFPSIDDFAYIPLAWAASDPSAYSRDALLQAFILHAPLWPLLVSGLEHTVGLADGLWALTLVLTVATAGAAFRLMRAAGAAGYLLPLALVIGYFGRVPGIGRGTYDGVLGDAFHMQWLALCCVLWGYDAFTRGRSARTGAWLGAAALAHPAVALHAAAVVAVATLLGAAGRMRRLLRTALACAVVSAPVALPLMRAMLGGHTSMGADDLRDVIVNGYQFRAPHHYSLDHVGAPAALAALLTVLAGLLGGILVGRLKPDSAWRALLALLAGHVGLAAVMVLLYGPWTPAALREGSLVPYLLDLTRTTPLPIALAGIVVVAAAEVRLTSRSERGTREIGLWLALYIALITLAVVARWTPADVAALLLALTLGMLLRHGALRRAAPFVAAAAGLGALAWAARHDVRRAPVAQADAELYAWARRETTPAALFVVPPTAEGFRFYTRRSVYVDYKVFPVSTPRAAAEWRRRLELVAAPDGRALASPGWEGAVFWDRSYAIRNTPARIQSLLRDTGADYFVWDSAGLRVPPFLPAQPDSAAGLTLAFTNDRYRVYLRTGSSGGP